jgi:arylamine N-acetyltransferase
MYTIYPIPVDIGGGASTYMSPIDVNNNEVTFTVMNEDKVLENDEDLELKLMTN